MIISLIAGIGIGSILAAIIGWFVAITNHRQSWINDLRKDIADYTGASYVWFHKYYEIEMLDIEEAEKVSRQRLELVPIVNNATCTDAI
jgi:hypothetical protein